MGQEGRDLDGLLQQEEMLIGLCHANATAVTGCWWYSKVLGAIPHSAGTMLQLFLFGDHLIKSPIFLRLVRSGLSYNRVR